MLWLRAVALGLVFAGSVSAQTVEELPPFAVNAARRSVDPTQLPFAARTRTAEQLTTAPTLDDALRSDPSFSLFRRTSSFAAHPTAQGVSLRGIGPSGASRSLVLLDGVPLNDPFGGWVQWSQVPRLALRRAEIAPGGGSGAWGNAALGGTIALVSTATYARSDAVQLELGSYGTRAADFSLGATVDSTAVRIDARTFETSGYHALRPADRGTVDRRFASDHQLGQLRLHQAIGSVDAEFTVRHFAESRLNGTALQRNTTDATFASLALRGSHGPADWHAVAYGQWQEFSSFFSAVSLDRATETPANHQFAVPARARGVGFTSEWSQDPARTTTAGLDLRETRGETQEDFLWTNDAFARRRIAGGRQQLAGAFVSHEERVLATMRASVSLRADHWRNGDGRRDEFDRASGTALRNDRYADRSGVAWSPAAGLVWEPHRAWRARAGAYRAFRLPTLNELHRPFRVGNTNTEANPDLKIETLHGAEAGIDFRGERLSVTLTAFAVELRDAVANLTIAQTPTLVSRQRQNLERIRITGLEAAGEWRVRESVALHAAALLSDAEVTRATAQPALVGLRPAQVPRHTVTAGMRAALPGRLQFRTQARWTGAQFEDDENLLRLAATTVVDAQLARRLGARSEIFASVENVFDEPVPVSRSAAGLITYGSPRFIRAGLRANW